MTLFGPKAEGLFLVDGGLDSRPSVRNTKTAIRTELFSKAANVTSISRYWLIIYLDLRELGRATCIFCSFFALRVIAV